MKNNKFDFVRDTNHHLDAFLDMGEVDLTEELADVVKFNMIASNGLMDKSPKKFELQRKLVLEEVDETIAALIDNNLVEIADGLCDVFVTAGFEEVMNGRIVEDIYGYKMSKGSFLVSATMLYEEDNVFPVVCSMIASMKNGKEMLQEVNRSNLSKFEKYHPEMEQDFDLECKQIEERSKGRYTGVAWSVTEYDGTKYVVYKDSKGKIMKPTCFKEPNIKQYIYIK